MNKIRRILPAICAAILAACSSTYHSAPIVDRTTGVRPAALFEGKPGYYIVKRGDTLSMIARTHKQRPADIIAWNSLSNPNDIKVDQVLRVAPPDAALPEVEAQANSVQPRAVEVRPLSAEPSSATPAPTSVAVPAATPAVTAPASGTNGGNKSSPRGEKQPYSDQTLSAMQAGRPTSGGAAVQASRADTPASVSPPVAADETITWQWPAEGKILATFVEGKNRGIDIAGKQGQRVNAAASGKVIYAGAFRGYGNLVIVKHSETLLSAYAHNKSILVKQGDSVTIGQQIAEMGNSDSDIVKLHFEIRRQGGKSVDPSQFLPKR